MHSSRLKKNQIRAEQNRKINEIKLMQFKHDTLCKQLQSSIDYNKKK